MVNITTMLYIIIDRIVLWVKSFHMLKLIILGKYFFMLILYITRGVIDEDL